MPSSNTDPLGAASLPVNLGDTMRAAGRTATVAPHNLAAPDNKLHKVAKQFEAVFMSEMLRLARPKDNAAKGFSTGESGSTWQVFMDQALGEAATVNDTTGMAKQIEKALRQAQGKGGQQ